MSGISSVALVNTKGVIVLYRAYKDDASRASLELFRARITSRSKEEKGRAPVVLLEGTTFAHIRRKDMYAVATTCSNFNPTLAIQYLYQLFDLLASYLGTNFGESQIRNHFTLVYELLDETLDYGIPQNCSPEVLKLYIMDGNANPSAAFQAPSQLTDQITGKTEWRRSGIVYRTNEMYIDLLESVNVLIGTDGTLLRSDVQGEIKVRCYLSGMPECKIVLNDRLLLENEEKELAQSMPSSDMLDCRGGRPRHQAARAVNIEDLSFHRCVRLGKFDSDRSVVFVPPDGIFELLRYRIADDVNLPFRVLIVVDQTKLKVTYNVRISTTFPAQVIAQNLVVKIPCPPNTTKSNVHTSAGKAKWEPAEQAIIWKIRTISGGFELFLNGSVDLSPQTHEKVWSRPPMTMQFKINVYTSSGLYVRNLRVIEASGYDPSRFVRYVTKAGSYQIRF
jgi:AP-2 complex subunit mu-1